MPAISIKNANGVTAFNTKIASTGEINFEQVLVCIPSRIRGAFDRKTIFHEIGHALGLDHIHEVDTIKARLRATEQGLGCSVMGYNSALESSVNNCTVSAYCADSNYAIFPGLMDRQICSSLYAFPAFSQAKYFSAMFMGFLNGSLETSLKSLLSNLNFIKIGEKNADDISMVVTTLLRLSMYQTTNIENTLALCELTARIQESGTVNILKLMRTLASLFMYLYQAYESEEAYLCAIYLSAFLASNLGGALLGEHVGQCGAYLTNTVVDKLGSLWRWGANTFSKSRHYFFAQEKDNDGSSNNDFAQITDFGNHDVHVYS